jgi:hypothetical protein
MQVATYNRVYDEVGENFGVEWVDGEEILASEWFKTEEERELRIDNVMEFQNQQI